jgi:uncharacterized protein with NRDE domain
MCTLAWGGDAGQLWACFNRDEQRSRPVAEMPELLGEPGSRRAFARDPMGKGTWFAVSERGYLVALLNNYPEERGDQGIFHRSRGQLVLQLAGQTTAIAADRFLRKDDLRTFAPFHLFILSMDKSFSYTWDGTALWPLACPRNFWTSSSYLQDKVVAWRTSFWEERCKGKSLNALISGEILQECSTENPAYGLTMDREDARTVSQIRVQMDESGFTFQYLGRDMHGPGYLQPFCLACCR